MILPDSEVVSLKSALRCWEWFGYISTAVVGLGCIGEFVAEFTSFPKSKSPKHKLARLSLIVLIFGIAGELLSAVRTSNLTGQLIANIEERAANAEYKGGEANDRASQNEREATQLRVDLENSKADTKTAQTRLEVEQRKTAEAQQKAAVAQLELKKALEQVSLRQEPRSFDSEAFLRVMKGNPTGSVDVIYTPGDWEAYRFAGQIFAALERANGWVVTDLKPIPEGVGEKTINSPTVPVPARFSGTGSRCGITLLVPGGTRDSLVDTREHTALWALVHGLEQGCLPNGAFGVSDESSSYLAPGHFVIVVSPKE